MIDLRCREGPSRRTAHLRVGSDRPVRVPPFIRGRAADALSSHDGETDGIDTQGIGTRIHGSRKAVIPVHPLGTKKGPTATRMWPMGPSTPNRGFPRPRRTTTEVVADGRYTYIKRRIQRFGLFEEETP